MKRIFFLLLPVGLLLSFTSMKRSGSFPVNEELNIRIADRLSYSLVAVEGGTFTMGATSEQVVDARDDEKPAHTVEVGRFFIGKYEVTQGLWYDVMGTNPSHFQGSETAYGSQWRDLPVEQVSWNDCQEFVRRLNARRSEMDLGEYSRWKFRLPTEAEWEYAARGGAESKGYKYSGSDDIGDVAWYLENCGGPSAGYDDEHSQTHPVGTKLPNELGLYDMSGNVYEWCQDWYDKEFYTRSLRSNPCNIAAEEFHVLRGGSWDHAAKYCRVANRSNDATDGKEDIIGLRLVLAP